MRFTMTETDIINLELVNNELAYRSDDNKKCKLKDYSFSYWDDINHIMNEQEVEEFTKELLIEWSI